MTGMAAGMEKSVALAKVGFARDTGEWISVAGAFGIAGTDR